MSKLTPFESLFSEPLRNGVSYPTRLRGAGVPLVNMREAFAHDTIRNQDMELVPITDGERRQYLLEEGDLLFARQSLTAEGAGRVVYVAEGPDRTWDSHLIRVKLDKNKADPRYYFYYFRSPPGRRNIESIVEQVAAAGIRGSDLRRLVVPYPTLRRQRIISDILGVLDNKIAANGRIVKILLDLAENKLALANQVNHDGEPVSLAAAAKWLSGGTPSTTEPSYWNGEIPWISAASLVNFLVDGSDRMVTTLGASNGTRLVDAGTTLCVVRGMSLKKEFRVGIATRTVAFGQDCKALVPRSDIGQHVFAYALRARRNEILGLVDEAGHGTGRLDSRLLGRVKLHLPCGEHMAHIEDELALLTICAVQKRRESVLLAELRDTLLPRLMSGGIRVRDAEKLVEEAM